MGLVDFNNADDFAPPDIRLGGLSVWIIARQFPDHDDYWDGNWLYVRIRMEARGAVIETAGPWIRTDEIASFAVGAVKMDTDLRGTAKLDCLEPVLKVTMNCRSLGHIDVVVDLTPDHRSQSHHFEFGLDQTCLRPILEDCQRILTKFPVKAHLTQF